MPDLTQLDTAEVGDGFERLAVDPTAAFRHQRQLAYAERSHLGERTFIGEHVA
jgi:hypothetical protein